MSSCKNVTNTSTANALGNVPFCMMRETRLVRGGLGGYIFDKPWFLALDDHFEIGRHMKHTKMSRHPYSKPSRKSTIWRKPWNPGIDFHLHGKSERGCMLTNLSLGNLNNEQWHLGGVAVKCCVTLFHRTLICAQPQNSKIQWDTYTKYTTFQCECEEPFSTARRFIYNTYFQSFDI